MIFPKESNPNGSSHTTVIDDVPYDVYRLIRLAENLPTETISLDFLKEHLEETNSWKDLQGNPCGPATILTITSNPLDWKEMRQANPELAKHISQIEEADTLYPILLLGERRILDGMHRLTKVFLQGETQIAIKRFHVLPKEAILRQH